MPEYRNFSARVARSILRLSALLQEGRTDAAIEFLTAECSRGAPHPYLLSMLGALEARAGFAQSGLARTTEAARRAPENPEVLTNHAATLTTLGYVADALPYFRKALEIEPEAQDTRIKYANALMIGERFDQAEAVLRSYIESFPGDLNGPGMLVELLRRAGKPDEAKTMSRRLVETDPSRRSSHLQLVNLLVGTGEIAAAVEHVEGLIATRPDVVNEAVLLARCDLAYLTGGPDAALETLAEIRKTRAGVPAVFQRWWQTLLAAGRLAEGWRACGEEPRRLEKLRQLPHRIWRGEPVEGRTLLIRGAEGIGEQLMYSRMFPLLNGKVERLIVECDERLAPIFSRTFPDIECVRWVDPPEGRLSGDDIDVQCVPRDLAALFLGSFDDFRTPPARLEPHPDGLEAARALRAQFPGKQLVGISWRSTSATGSGGKSIPLTHWAGLLDRPDIQFVNLQYGSTESEIGLLKEGHGIDVVSAPGIDLTADIDRCMGLVAGLDLVVTVSNVTAHYAGTVGVPVWILIPKLPLWHWFWGRDDSPWYPVARLYRQAPEEDWQPVLDRLTRDLSDWRQSGL